MRFYAETLINNIDLKTETARLSKVTFDAAPLQRKAQKVVVAGPELSPAGKTLEKGRKSVLHATPVRPPIGRMRPKHSSARLWTRKASRPNTPRPGTGSRASRSSKTAARLRLRPSRRRSSLPLTISPEPGPTSTSPGSIVNTISPWPRSITRTHWPLTVHLTWQNKPRAPSYCNFLKIRRTKHNEAYRHFISQSRRRYSGV